MRKIKTADWMIMFLCEPGETPVPVGILLLPGPNRIVAKLKSDLTSADETILAVWDGMVRAFQQESTGSEMARSLEVGGSHMFRLSSRQTIEVNDLNEALETLYRDHVEQQLI
jgi:hypothetical protein